METNRALIVQIIILMIIIKSSVGAFNDHFLNDLTEQVGNDGKKTLIVLVDTVNKNNDLNDERFMINDDSYSISEANKARVFNDIDNILINENYHNLLYNLMRNSKHPENNEVNEVEEILIEEALRARCQKKIKCENKCPQSEERKPKKERYCQKSCKAVYDDLLNCPPSNKKPKNKQNKKRGKTLPPSW
ncbi:uncharacterized protein LOC111358069 isoform X3 [Spodoptera litura]|uniref:Uncharacterized protein LOC111358069 isoform X3 n=1 Tax=Spodoptera litura TaxID=69820 RepID=A0A9J7EIM8_SPOLT|nr:uncharacterized protein LOC111358069 isoform X3 [Spodoptera litura]XP_022828723.1 uncharacterized protein LOC111358069 isoform X3 [Spodoptera litura]